MDEIINDYDKRHTPFEGCFNFRDIGGYKNAQGQAIRWGRYFRAGRQERMTSNDLKQVAKFKIETQIDLRFQVEIDSQGRGPLESLGSRYIWNSVLTDASLEKLRAEVGITGARYLNYIEYAPEMWLRLFEFLAEPKNYPTLVHCVAGKDRTGVTTALVLYILGVERPVIEADYVLTNRDVPRHTHYVETHGGLPEKVSRETFMATAGVSESAIKEFLDGVEDKPGGPLGYLRSIGVTEDMQASIRSILLEDA